MSKRAAWLAFGALSVGLAISSCTGADGNANFENTGGDGSGGDASTTGATSSDAGATTAGPSGGQPSGEAGSGTSPGEGGMSSGAGAGQPSAGGDATFGGMPGGDAGAPSGDAGAGGAGPGRAPCESGKSCEEGEVCVKAGCDKQPEGTCMKAPATPVCGCDGLTYYDGALAVASGIDVRNQGTCTGEDAVACEGECKGENVSCGMVELREGNCEAKVGGICWQLPAECPKLELAPYNLCGSEKCLPLCEAVREGVHAVPGGLLCAVVN